MTGLSFANPRRPRKQKRHPAPKRGMPLNLRKDSDCVRKTGLMRPQYFRMLSYALSVKRPNRSPVLPSIHETVRFPHDILKEQKRGTRDIGSGFCSGLIQLRSNLVKNRKKSSYNAIRFPIKNQAQIRGALFGNAASKETGSRNHERRYHQLPKTPGYPRPSQARR